MAAYFGGRRRMMYEVIGQMKVVRWGNEGRGRHIEEVFCA